MILFAGHFWSMGACPCLQLAVPIHAGLTSQHRGRARLISGSQHPSVPAALTLNDPRPTVPQLTQGVLGDLQTALVLLMGAGEGRCNSVIVPPRSWGAYDNRNRSFSSEAASLTRGVGGLGPSEAAGMGRPSLSSPRDSGRPGHSRAGRCITPPLLHLHMACVRTCVHTCVSVSMSAHVCVTLCVFVFLCSSYKDTLIG